MEENERTRGVFKKQTGVYQNSSLRLSGIDVNMA